MTAAVSGSGTPTSCEVSSALVRSFMCRLMRKPGLKLRSSIIGALASSTALPASPPRMASKTASGDTPAFWERTSASETAAMFTATTT